MILNGRRSEGECPGKSYERHSRVVLRVVIYFTSSHLPKVPTFFHPRGCWTKNVLNPVKLFCEKDSNTEKNVKGYFRLFNQFLN